MTELVRHPALPKIPDSLEGDQRKWAKDLLDFVKRQSQATYDQQYHDDLIVKGPWVDVRAYGAVGDGVTDDTTAIQNAINAIPANGHVIAPAGFTYAITHLDFANKIGFKFTCLGKLKLTGSSGVAGIELGDGTNAAVHMNICVNEIDGQDKTDGRVGIHFRYGSRNNVHVDYLHDCATGLLFQKVDAGAGYEHSLSNIYYGEITSCDTGIYFKEKTAATNGLWEANHLSGIRIISCSDGIKFDADVRAGSMYVTGNINCNASGGNDWVNNMTSPIHANILFVTGVEFSACTFSDRDVVLNPEDEDTFYGNLIIPRDCRMQFGRVLDGVDVKGIGAGQMMIRANQASDDTEVQIRSGTTATPTGTILKILGKNLEGFEIKASDSGAAGHFLNIIPGSGSTVDLVFQANGTSAFWLDNNGTLRLRSSTVAGLPSASPAAQVIYVSDETGGAVLAFSDGTNWRRVTDRAVVS